MIGCWQRAEDADQEAWDQYQFEFDDPILHNDPNGDCPICGIVGAVVGGVIGATIEGGSIVDRTTSKQLGNVTQSVVTGSDGQVKRD